MGDAGNAAKINVVAARCAAEPAPYLLAQRFVVREPGFKALHRPARRFGKLQRERVTACPLDDLVQAVVQRFDEQGAATAVWAATAPELAGRGGMVLEDCAPSMPHTGDHHPWSGYDAAVLDDEAAGTLWQASLEMLAACKVNL